MIARAIRSVFSREPDPLLVEALAESPEDAQRVVAKQAADARAAEMMDAMAGLLGLGK